MQRRRDDLPEGHCGIFTRCVENVETREDRKGRKGAKKKKVEEIGALFRADGRFTKNHARLGR